MCKSNKLDGDIVLKEVGSNFWDYDLSSEEKDLYIPSVYETKTFYFFLSGRIAIYSLIKSLKLCNEEVLLPSFTCESVIEPFVQCSCKVFFYGINEDLTIDTNSINTIIENNNPKLILFHSYFGFNTYKNIDKKYFEYLKNSGLILIEDLTQSFYSSFEKLHADFFVASIRKFFAIPSGGVVISPKKKLEIKYNIQYDLMDRIDSVALNAFDLKKRFITNDNSLTVNKQQFLDKYLELGDLLKKCDDIIPITSKSLPLYRNVNVEQLCKTRRNNYLYLLNNLSALSNIKIIFDTLPDDVVPLYFPIFIDKNRNEFQKKLAKSSIYCPIIWPKSKYIKICSKQVEYIYSSILCIPIDQRYGLDDMARICNVIKSI